MESNKIICHIAGLDNNDKEILKKTFKNSKKFDLIDLDKLNDEILNNKEIQNQVKQYTRFKKNNNDKHKEVFKSMTKFWEENLILKVSNLVTGKKKSILLGKNHHFKFVSKKIDFKVSKKFIIDKDSKLVTKNIIKKNINNNINSILNGTYPLENLDFNKQQKKFLNFEKSYIKNGYSKTDINEIISILKMHNDNKIDGKGLWISINEEYNIGSQIHPIKSKNNSTLFGYTDPVLSLIDSFNFNDEQSIYKISENKVKTIDLDKNKLDKLKKSRYIYYVSKDNFIPYSSNDKFKYNTQNSVTILEKEKIGNVYNKFRELEIIPNNSK